MRDQLQQRLKKLKEEYESGQKLLQELTEKQQEVRGTLLRIQGAIQVLHEELAEENVNSEAIDA